MKLSNNKSYINQGSEGKPERDKSRWTQWLYFIFLALAIGYFSYLIIRPYYFINVTGKIHVEQLSLSSPENAVITAINVSEGSLVKEQQILAKLDPATRCQEASPSSSQQNLEQERVRKLSYDISLNKAKLQRLRASYEIVTAEKLSETARALEINASLFDKDSSAQAEREKDDLQAEINYVSSLINLAKDQIEQLKTNTTTNNTTTNMTCQPLSLSSPRSGKVNYIYKYPGEFAARGDVIINITPDQADVAILLELDKEEISSFVRSSQEKEYLVTLPNGDITKAVVGRAGSGAIADLHKALESTKTAQNTKLFLIPSNTDDKRLWAEFAGITVNIQGDK